MDFIGIDLASGPDQTAYLVLRMQQGHRYRLGNSDVIALESGGTGTVAELVKGQPWLGRKHHVDADMLQPLPMRYFHGQVPG